MKQADQYLKIVEWSKEDGCYVGTCPGLLRGGVHGKDETKVYIELCHAVEEALELYRQDKKPLPPATAGKKYSGKFLLRTGKELHRTLAIRALQRGESINNYCLKALGTAASRQPA